LVKAMSSENTRPSLPQIEIRFMFEGERYIARLGRDDTGKPIEIVLDGGHLRKTAGQLATQLLQHGVDIKDIRGAVFAGPLAILLDRIIALDGSRR
jgi:preprotein translocase subunit SecD